MTNKCIGSFKKMKVNGDEKAYSRPNPINHFENIPEEILQHILSHLPYENIDKLRSVNHRFNNAGKHLLKKEYSRLKQEVTNCGERAGSRLQIYDDANQFGHNFLDYVTKIFWFAVMEFLSNSFCPFNVLKGYLVEGYSVSGKTIDVVRRLLFYKDMRNPLLFVVEMMIGRGEKNTNMRYFDDHYSAFLHWLTLKTNCEQEIKSIHVPIFNKKQPGLNLPKNYANNKKRYYAMTLDMLTTLYKNTSKEKHLLLPTNIQDWQIYQQGDTSKFISVLKPGLDANPELYADSDYSEEDENTESDLEMNEDTESDLEMYEDTESDLEMYEETTSEDENLQEE